MATQLWSPWNKNHESQTQHTLDVRMRKAHPNHRLVKMHRSYTVHEIADALHVHRNTVREWIRVGLPVLEGRPVLMLGQDIIAFLRARRAKKRRPCGPDQMYCFRCRVPRLPAADMVDFAPINLKVANLVGICPVCDTVMYRCVPAAQVHKSRTNATITSSQALLHINEMTDPSPNSDLR